MQCAMRNMQCAKFKVQSKDMDILQYTFFQNALIGALLASILCGFVGTYIVTRRLVSSAVALHMPLLAASVSAYLQASTPYSLPWYSPS